MALTKPFAENGDKKAIPQTTSDGSVSFDRGFGSFYALPPEEGGLFIDRAQFNQLMFDTTSQVLDNKQAIATKANANATVNLTGNQTIAGTKTFSAPVVVPNATANTHAVNLSQLNTKANQATTYTKTEVNNLVNTKANQATTYTKTEVDTRVNAKANANATVNLTGNQTIAGIKTFSAVPVCAKAPTNANQIANKAYVDGLKQVPDYSAAINITPNKAFTPAFNGVVEVYCIFNNTQGFRISLGNTDNTNVILGASGAGISSFYAGGQAIIVKGQTYFFTATIHTIRKAIICPFKGVNQ